MRYLIFLILISGNVSLRAQLNCKTVSVAGKGKTITCLHANGKASTIETWDEQRRNGNFKGFDNTGKELFSHSLRTYAGHSSVNCTYHPNGQVKRSEYSSAPDGGIQFYHTITEFDPSGKQTSFLDMSRPDGRMTLSPAPPPVTKPPVTKPTPAPKPSVEKPLPPPNECAVPSMTVYRIKNKTPYTVRVVLKTAQGSQYISSKETLITLKPRQTLVADSVLMGNLFLTPENSLTFEIAQSQNTFKKFELSRMEPVLTSPQRKVWTWLVTEE